MATMAATSITTGQYGFLKDLVEARIQRELTPEELFRMAMLTKHEAHEIIDREIARRNERQAQAKAEVQKVEDELAVAVGLVPDGYYAIDIDDTVKFYRIRHGKKGGRWENVQFIDVQASDEFHPVKLREKKAAIYDAIRAQGINEARQRYGHEIGRCYVCNRTLTDELSRELGIGPVCRSL